MSEPRFCVGSRVRVLDLAIEGHVRVPAYVRGKAGVVERYCGPYLNPEELAFGRAAGPAMHLYQVEFLQNALWERYEGDQGDRLFIEIYEHWLEAAA
jgi:nitrile hydratase